LSQTTRANQESRAGGVLDAKLATSLHAAARADHMSHMWHELHAHVLLALTNTHLCVHQFHLIRFRTEWTSSES
jgi:hypothetical protein